MVYKTFYALCKWNKSTHNVKKQKFVPLYDGHTSRISLWIVHSEEKITRDIIKFSSHLTDRLQSLDKCVLSRKNAMGPKIGEIRQEKEGKGLRTAYERKIWQNIQ